MRAVDDRNRRTPIALTADTPVAQAILRLLFTQTLSVQCFGNLFDTFVNGEAVEFAGIDQLGSIALVTIGFVPSFQRIFVTFASNDLLDREIVLLGECEVAFVMSRYAHHSAFTVAHQNVVTDPNRHFFARQRMTNIKARGHALLFHRGHVGFAHATLGTFGDEGLKRFIAFGQTLSKRMLGSDGNKRYAHQGIGTRRVNGELLFFAIDRVREDELHTGGLTDPVRLHGANLFRPAAQLIEVLQQFVGVLGDAQVVARDFALFNESAGTPAATVNDLFVCQDRHVYGVPVHDLGLAVADALFEHLQEHPLIPTIVFRRAGGDFTIPVEG